MAINVVCRSCGEAFTAENRHAGRVTDCPICGTENQVPLKSSVVASEIREEDRSGFEKVGIGLTTVLVAVCVIIAYILLVTIAGASNSFDLLEFLALFRIPIVVGVPVLMFVGTLLCLNVPVRTRARGLVTWSAIASGTSLLVQVILTFGGITQFVTPLLFLRLTMLLGILGLVNLVFFVLFLSRSADYLGDEKTSRKAMSVLVFGGIFFALYVGLAMYAANANRPPDETFGIILGVTIFVLAILFILRYVGSIAQLRGTIRRSLAA